MTEANKNYVKTSWVILPGCMFIGIGLGFLLGKVQIGLFLGMGVGFLLTGLLSMKKNK